MEGVSTPHRGGHRWHEFKKPLRAVKREVKRRGRGGVVLVGDDTVAPAVDLVSKNPGLGQPHRTDCAFGDDPPPFPVQVRNGCHLDHVAPGGNRDDEGRMVEIARRTSLHQGGQ